MVTLAPRYDLREDAPGDWSVIDHMPDGEHYVHPGTVVEVHLTEEQAFDRLRKLRDDDMPRVQAQLERIYRRNGMLPTK